MPDDTELRDVLGDELAERAGADVERWLRSGAAGHGTKSGARVGARFTKVDHFELELDLAEAPDAALRRAREVLSEEGELRDLGDDAAAQAVSAVVPSGWWNMNPALVTVTVAVAPEEQGTRVRIGAYALEGLLKQRAARKATTRIAESLGAVRGTSER
jgi:hypothetical protein